MRRTWTNPRRAVEPYPPLWQSTIPIPVGSAVAVNLHFLSRVRPIGLWVGCGCFRHQDCRSLARAALIRAGDDRDDPSRVWIDDHYLIPHHHIVVIPETLQDISQAGRHVFCRHIPRYGGSY